MSFVAEQHNYQNNQFWREYSNYVDASWQIETTYAPIGTAPMLPSESYYLLNWFLSDVLSVEPTSETVNHQETMWKEITGNSFSSYLASGCDMLGVIQDIQYREAELLKMYNNGRPLVRNELMKLHTRFFEEYECRVTDFHDNLSFRHLALSHIQSQFV
jgi:hypothetical protein